MLASSCFSRKESVAFTKMGGNSAAAYFGVPFARLFTDCKLNSTVKFLKRIVTCDISRHMRNTVFVVFD